MGTSSHSGLQLLYPLAHGTSVAVCSLKLNCFLPEYYEVIRDESSPKALMHPKSVEVCLWLSPSLIRSSLKGPVEACV